MNLRYCSAPAGRKLFRISMILLLAAGGAIAQEQKPEPTADQCMVCHEDDENWPEDFSRNDVHLQPGLSCAGCHGGDPTSDDEDIGMSPSRGYRGVPSKKEIPNLCGKCHSDINFMRQYKPRIATDQVQQYHTSVHGKKLAEGDQKVADCTSCHSAHAILPADDPRSTVYPLNVPNTCKKCHSDPDYMAEYGIHTNQYDQFAASVHGKALLENQDTGAPACNDCHGNHGAVPPGLQSISHVCGTCHVNNMQYFSRTRMSEEFQKEDLHGCEECHGNHAVKKTFDGMVGISEESVCTDCHDEGEKGYLAAEKIGKQVGTLAAAYDSADARADKVQQIGMDDIDIRYLLQDAHQSLIEARTLVHTFDPKAVGGKAVEGLQKIIEAQALETAQFEESRKRRLGFTVATFFISLLAVALFLKIRQIESSQSRRNNSAADI